MQEEKTSLRHVSPKTFELASALHSLHDEDLPMYQRAQMDHYHTTSYRLIDGLSAGNNLLALRIATHFSERFKCARLQPLFSRYEPFLAPLEEKWSALAESIERETAPAREPTLRSFLIETRIPTGVESVATYLNLLGEYYAVKINATGVHGIMDTADLHARYMSSVPIATVVDLSSPEFLVTLHERPSLDSFRPETFANWLNQELAEIVRPYE